MTIIGSSLGEFQDNCGGWYFVPSTEVVAIPINKLTFSFEEITIEGNMLLDGRLVILEY